MTPIEPPHAPVESSDLAKLVSPTDAVIDALLEGRTEDALAGLDLLEKDSPESADAWTVYRSEAWARAGELEKALEALVDFEGRFPESPWLAKARFHRAEVARGLKRFNDAEGILREEATILRSPERRIELGEEILAAAEKLSESAENAPSAERREELAERAQLLLMEALRLETNDAFKLRITRRLAELALRRSDWQEIQRRTSALASLLGSDASPGQRATQLEARVVSARATLMLGDATTARLELMRAAAELEELAGSNAPTARTQHLTGLALAFLGDAWRQSGQPLFAIDAWTKVRSAHAVHPQASRAASAIATAFFEIGRNDDALAAWEAVELLPLVAAEPKGERQAPLAAALQDAIDRTLGQPTPGLDAAKRTARIEAARLLLVLDRHEDAIERFRSYVVEFPGAEDWSAAQSGIVTAHYERAGDLLEDREDPSLADLDAACTAFLAFADEFPLDHRAGSALMSWAQLPSTFARRYLDGESEDRAQKTKVAIDRLQEVSSRLERANPQLSSQALYEAAMLLQNELEEPASAMVLFRRVQGGYAHAASEQLSRMEETVLRVRTPRLARPGAPVAVEVDVRNIERITVQAVKLDLTQYFARHGEAGGIDRLDLDLIAPDVEEENTIEEYERFANLTRTIQVPVQEDLSEPGVYAVTVVAEGKRATTLAVRSNLDLIVRRSDAEVFAFVTEVDASGAATPAGGVDVTLSYDHDNKRETLSLATNEDGVVSFRAPTGVTFGARTAVLAARGANVASTEIEGRAPGQTIALGPRAHIQTDRTAYRPGDTIGFRAVLREVSSGTDGATWTIPAQSDDPTRSFRTELIAPGGLVVESQVNADLSAHGTLAGELTLDAGAPSGDWMVRTTAPSG
ncbi:MAG: MG2 domain-containing protein, partial [Planctomycetota bacterium]